MYKISLLIIYLYLYIYIYIYIFHVNFFNSNFLMKLEGMSKLNKSEIQKNQLKQKQNQRTKMNLQIGQFAFQLKLFIQIYQNSSPKKNIMNMKTQITNWINIRDFFIN